MPVALKDNIAVRGLRTTAGSKVLADWLPDDDATVAMTPAPGRRDLRGQDSTCTSSPGAAPPTIRTTARCATLGTRSAFRRAPAAARAPRSRPAPATAPIGTDTGGSIRLPSAINGIVGIRPTYGRVSNHGIIPLAWSMDTAGPMTRTVEDCALMFGATGRARSEGPDQRAGPRADYLADLRWGVEGPADRRGPGVLLPSPAAGRCSTAVTARRSTHWWRSGAQVVEVEIEHIHGNISAQLTIESAEPSTYHQRWLRERPDDYGEDVADAAGSRRDAAGDPLSPGADAIAACCAASS